jgi:hypothetical protein
MKFYSALMVLVLILLSAGDLWAEEKAHNWGKIEKLTSERTSPPTGTILLREGGGDIYLKVTKKTEIITETGVEYDFGDLTVNQWVKVWYDGPVAESHPMQGAAATIVVLKEKPAPVKPSPAKPGGLKQVDDEMVDGDIQDDDPQPIAFDIVGIVKRADWRATDAVGAKTYLSITVEKGPNQTIVINVPETVPVEMEAADGSIQKVTRAALRVDQKVSVKSNGMMTRSMPPQTTAVQVRIHDDAPAKEKNPAPRHWDIRGTVESLSVDGGNGGFSINSKKFDDTDHDRARIRIREKTKVFRVEKDRRVEVGLDQLKNGQTVQVKSDGAVMESYPVQFVAVEIEILPTPVLDGEQGRGKPAPDLGDPIITGKVTRLYRPREGTPIIEVQDVSGAVVRLTMKENFNPTVADYREHETGRAFKWWNVEGGMYVRAWGAAIAKTDPPEYAITMLYVVPPFEMKDVAPPVEDDPNMQQPVEPDAPMGGDDTIQRPAKEPTYVGTMTAPKAYDAGGGRGMLQTGEGRMNKVFIKVPADVLIVKFGEEGHVTRMAFSDLKDGVKLKVWTNGMIAKSMPPQATAEFVEVVD